MGPIRSQTFLFFPSGLFSYLLCLKFCVWLRLGDKGTVIKLWKLFRPISKMLLLLFVCKVQPANMTVTNVELFSGLR